MDFPWIEVGALLGGQAIFFTIIDRIKYRRQLKRDKEAETKKAEAEAAQEEVALQEKKIDLGDKYIEQVLELSEKTYQATVKNNADIHDRVDGLAKQMAEFSGQLSQLSTKVDSVDDRLVKVESKVESVEEQITRLNERHSDMESFLNGQYQDYLRSIGKSPKQIEAQVRAIKTASRRPKGKSKKSNGTSKPAEVESPKQ